MNYRKWVNKLTKKVAEESLTKKHIIGDFCLFWIFKKDSFDRSMGILDIAKNVKEVK